VCCWGDDVRLRAGAHSVCCLERGVAVRREQAREQARGGARAGGGGALAGWHVVGRRGAVGRRGVGARVGWQRDAHDRFLAVAAGPRGGEGWPRWWRRTSLRAVWQRGGLGVEAGRTRRGSGGEADSFGRARGVDRGKRRQTHGVREI
jgi:hypothetical protein